MCAEPDVLVVYRNAINLPVSYSEMYLKSYIAGYNYINTLTRFVLVASYTLHGIRNMYR